LRSAFGKSPGVAPQVERALALRSAGRLADAERELREAVARDPGHAVAATNLGIVLLEQDRGAEGAAFLMQALEADPACAAAHYNLANALRSARRREEAARHYAAAVELDAGFPYAREELMFCLLEACAWEQAETHAAALRTLVAERPAAEWVTRLSPLTTIYLGLETQHRKQVAAHHAAEAARGVRVLPQAPVPSARPQRLRVGYFSRDFRDHPVGHLLRGVLGQHDRERFEISAISCGPDDGSEYRRAFETSVDHFVDVQADSDEAAARRIAAGGIDVLLDLGGHTLGSRLPVLARRPALVQAHYLGYPGTTGAPYLDAFFTDEVVTPQGLEGEFTERVVRVPRCFMASAAEPVDSSPLAPPSRAEEGLPADAFVYCNFGTASRMSQDTFELWLDVLRATPASVLWLAGTEAQSVQRLRDRTAARGVEPKRLVFAQRAPSKRGHLARLALADLMLDTIGWYNGHSTTADALWAGVPVLTAPAGHFAGRVAASLVQAAGLDELVAADRAQYRSLAIQAGTDHAYARSLRQQLKVARAGAPFFDTRGRVADLEAAIDELWVTTRGVA
jgi:predicted O-linked N-acetylglucosamine transferase (SPINDLY family)